MNIEHQKTDALSDAVEVPDGATHYVETPMERIYLKESYKYGWKCYVFGAWHPYDAEDNEDIKPL